MKRIIIACLLALTMCLGVGASVFADDLEVEVVAIGDNIDVNVGVNATGAVSIVVDGYDIDAMAAQVGAMGSGFAWVMNWTAQQWYTNFNTEMTAYNQALGNIDQVLGNMDGALVYLLEAEAKLAEGQELTSADIAAIRTNIASIGAELDNLQTTARIHNAEVSRYLELLQERYDILRNEILPNLEHQLSLLGDVVADQKLQIDTSKQALDAANENIVALTLETESLRSQFIASAWIMGGVALILLVGIIMVAVRKR